MSKVGLVTVLYKSDEVLEGFFKCLSKQSYKDYHLYLVDNSPSFQTDQLIEQLSALYPLNAFTCVKNTDNVGVAKGNNQGIQLALAQGADYVILLNNDIEFDQDYLLEQMVKAAAERPEHLIVPKIFYYNSRTIWMAGGHMLSNKGIVDHVGVDEPDGEKFNTDAHFNYAPTCFMLISKEVFDVVGLMDEKYFVYYDDTDFIIRATQKGYKIFYMAALEIYHKVSSSTGGGETLFSIYYNNRNRFYFINKNLRFPEKQVALAYSLITRVGCYLRYKTNERKQLLKAIKDGFSMK